MPVMHDTPESDNHSGSPVADLIADLMAADPAAAPDIADTIAVRLEEGLAGESPEPTPPA